MTTPDPQRDSEPTPISGVVIGKVTDNDDPEGLGRVKVSFPWRDVDDESRWAPIATPMAGDDMGTYFLPEEDDQVLVAFERGDIHYPYVVGSLWNKNQTPPADNEGSNDVRTIKSRSGHELSFDDNSTEGVVEIETAAGHTITLDDTSGGEKVTIEDNGANKIEFDAVSGSLSIESGASLSIEAPSIEIAGDGNVKIEASGMLTLKGAVIQLN